MIDKKISVGTLITIATVIGTFVYTQGATQAVVSHIELDTSENTNKIMSNSAKIQKIEVDVARIEAKIDEGFKRLETLIIEN